MLKAVKYCSQLILLSVLPTAGIVSFADAEGVQTERIERHQARIFAPVNLAEPVFQSRLISPRITDFADLKISETVSPATFSQSNSSIAPLDDGRFVVAWQDERLGSEKIFARLYDSTGNPVISDVLLVGRDDGYNLIEPQAITDGSGGFCLAWRDEASGRIFISRYDSALQQVIAPIAVNDDTSRFSGPYDIDGYADTRLVAVWEDYGIDRQVSLRIFNSSGVPLTGAVRVSDTGSVARWVPSVAIDGVGRMAVAWEDYRYGNGDIYFQLVNADGSLSGTNLGIVEAAYDNYNQYLPVIAYSDRDGYAISWLDCRNGMQDVYFRRYVRGVGLIGGSVRISPDDSLVKNWDIGMDVASSGDLALVWAEVGQFGRILLQKFSSSFEPDGDIIRINSLLSYARWQTSLAIGVSDRLICSWTDFRAGNEDIYFGLLSWAGTPLFDEERLVNTDSEGAISVEPDVAVINDTRGLIVFTDERNDRGDIFMQLVGTEGTLIENNERVNTDSTVMTQSWPAAAVSSSKILIVWNDERPVMGNTGVGIFGRFADLNGVLEESDFMISDSGNLLPKGVPAAGISSGGGAMVAWVDCRHGTGHIYARHLQADGEASGDEFLVSSLATDSDNDDVHVSVDSNDIFTIAWLSRGIAGGPAAVVTTYGTAGDYIDRFTYDGGIPGVAVTDVSVDVNDEGDIFLLWEGVGQGKGLYISVLSNDGTIIHPHTEVAFGLSTVPAEPDISVDDEGFAAVTWIEDVSGTRQASYRIFNPALSSIESGAVSLEGPEFMTSPSTALYGHTVWFAWSDPRDGGLNVYATQLTYSSTDVVNDDTDPLPSHYSLAQNYPNPFNPATIIGFIVPAREHVNISVFNSLGQKVAAIVNKIYEAGHYSVRWDGRDTSGRPMPSGVYFYTLKAGVKQITKKMILVK
jgi:hypothetical protein